MSEIVKLTRREFIRTAGVVAMGKMLASPVAATVEAVDAAAMPTRPFGKTGIRVPILSFGGSLHLPQLMLRQAVLWGVTYWDTAHSYMGGNSELRIGKYFEKFPEETNPSSKDFTRFPMLPKSA